MRRYIVLIVATLMAATVCAMGLVIGLTTRESAKVNAAEKFSLVKTGMTKRQVLELLGRASPAKDTTSHYFTSDVDEPPISEKDVSYWYSTDSRIEIWFDRSNRVVFRRFWTKS